MIKDSKSNNSNKSNNDNNKKFSDRSYDWSYPLLTLAFVKLDFYIYDYTKLQCLKFSGHCSIFSK